MEKKLFLDSWIIKAKVSSKSEFIDKESMGETELDIVNQCSLIKILSPSDFPEGCIMKYCAEKILVHELLHCKYNWVGYHNEPSYEEFYFKTKDHALLEEMAKSLIMVKCGVDLDYFISKK